jgi:transmembrane sensor
MNPDATPSPDIEAASAAWLARRDRGLLPAEQDEFLQWLTADPRHRECFARHERTWRELDALSQWRPAHSTQPNPDLLAREPAGRRSPALWLALGAAAALAITAGIVGLSQRAAAPALLPSPAVTVRDYDQKVLEDGSVIDLNRGGEIEVRYTPAERQVWLTRGEAHFTVAKNPARPFIVRAGKVDVRAVGTAFNVRLDPALVEVLVTEGHVQVNPPGQGDALPVLAAGQRAVIPASGQPHIDTVAADEMSRLLAWQPRQLEFDSARLADVVAAFNRHNRVQLELGDAALADLPVGASFRSSNVEGFVRLLEASFGVRAERRGDRIVLQRAP